MSTKPTVVGVYGVPGSGKTFLLNKLKKDLGEDSFAFYDGSGVISSHVPGGLSAFRGMDEQEKTLWRERAIYEIAKECSASGRVAVVAGHLLFWDENAESGTSVWTTGDQNTYTHILYLDVPTNLVSERRLKDSKRSRSSVSVEHLSKWQLSERKQLKDLCYKHGILFSTVVPENVRTLLGDIQRHTEGDNLSYAHVRLDAILANQSPVNTVLVLDGDRTLIPVDTGGLFWKLASAGETCPDPLKAVFSNSGYTYNAFRQVALLYDEIPKGEFDTYCEEVAATVTMHREMVLMLTQATARGVGAVVVTCGLQSIWEKIINRAGLSEAVKVIGGGRIGDVVITGEVKRALVAHSRAAHHLYVWAFGDSVLDLPMLKEADRAVVVVGERHSRSRSMDAALLNAIEDKGLQAFQVLLPGTAAPRLDIIKLPVINITEEHFIDLITRRPSIGSVAFADENAAKLLMTPMRDSRVCGPALREAHQDVGQHLTRTLLSRPDLIGLEEYPIPHVQGHQTTGHRFRYEDKTSIVALMRGGEPMALGVNKAMPLAMFTHAKHPNEVKKEHVQGQETVILVDSVVNSGKSVVEFVRHIRKLHATIRIFVVVGVVQAGSLSEGSLAEILAMDGNVNLVGLRKSGNKFTGKGTTDTGNRLFNTTHLQ